MTILHEIKSKAAISLPFNFNCKAIAAFFFLFRTLPLFVSFREMCVPDVCMLTAERILD